MLAYANEGSYTPGEGPKKWPVLTLVVKIINQSTTPPLLHTLIWSIHAALHVDDLILLVRP